MSSHSILRFRKNLSKLNIDDIQLLIDNKIDESQNLEYKTPTKNVNKDSDYLAKAISGFLNTDGGIVIYGVSENREKYHIYPVQLEWSGTPKEQLENLLKSRIQPWEENIRIHRIRNYENVVEGIFVIEIPKSRNPPHMSDYRYYQRLNYQTQPMNHQSVFRAFQTSWIRKQEIIQNVVDPLYSEIAEFIEDIQKYEFCEPSKYKNIMLHNRFPFNLLNAPLKRTIVEFYEKIQTFNTEVALMPQILKRVFTEEVCNMFRELRDRMEEQGYGYNISFTAEWFASGGISETSTEYPRNKLLDYDSTKNYLQSFRKNMKLTGYKVNIMETKTKIPNEKFEKIYHRSRSKLTRNPAIISIKEQQTELSALGKEALTLMMTS